MRRAREVLQDLTSERNAVQTHFESKAAEAGRLEERHRTLQDEERRTLDELAQVYLPDLSPDTVSHGFEALKSRLDDALASQERHRGRIVAETADAARRVQDAERRLGEVEGEAAGLTHELDDARARVETVLDADDTHGAGVEEHRTLMELRERLRQRQARLGAAASVERRRYEGDRLFRYLYDQDYGGPEYRRGALTRRLDRWLARRIDYETLARNYRILKLGPRQLAAEIRRLGRRAEELEQAIDAREEEVSREQGLLPLLQRRVEVESLLTEVHGALDRERSAHASLQGEMRALEQNRGRDFEAALDLYREHLQGQTIRQLEALACDTPNPRDDRLVRRLEEVRREMETVNRNLADCRDEMTRASKRLDGIGSLHDASRRAAAGGRASFPDTFDIGSILERLIHGRAGAEEVMSEVAGLAREDSIFVEVERPYFDAVYKELTAAFDAGLEQGHVVDTRWSTEDGVETEVVVHAADGSVLRRRVTRRTLGVDPSTRTRTGETPMENP